MLILFCPTLNAFVFAAFVTITKVFYSLWCCSVTLLPPLKEEGYSPFLTADLLDIWASKGEWGHCLCWKISLYNTVQCTQREKKGYLFVVLYHLWVWATVSHLSDLLTHQREQPDVEQQLASRGRALEIDHQHHSKQEEEGKIKYNVPVKFNLWGGVQVHQPGPAAQRLHGLQAVDRKITAVRETMPCFHVSTVYSTSNDI